MALQLMASATEDELAAGRAITGDEPGQGVHVVSFRVQAVPGVRACGGSDPPAGGSDRSTDRAAFADAMLCSVDRFSIDIFPCGRLPLGLIDPVKGRPHIGG